MSVVVENIYFKIYNVTFKNSASFYLYFVSLFILSCFGFNWHLFIMQFHFTFTYISKAAFNTIQYDFDIIV